MAPASSPEPLPSVLKFCWRWIRRLSGVSGVSRPDLVNLINLLGPGCPPSGGGDSPSVCCGGKYDPKRWAWPSRA